MIIESNNHKINNLLIVTLANEEWSYIEGTYWTVITMTSVGYGDLEVKYTSTRIFGVFFILICVCMYAAVVSNLFEIATEDFATTFRNRKDEECATALERPFPFQMSDKEWAELLDKNFARNAKNTISKERLILDILLKKQVVNYSETVKPIFE